VGQVSVDNSFHYLWGGGYVMDAAMQGYIAYTNCTSTLAEVVPFGGKFPTLGTNPHSWAFPTQEAVGFPIVIDWATSTVAMGRVQQFRREGKQLPEGAAVDAAGNPTTDPNKAVSLLPFGAHKGYGLSLINELYGALIGGSLPTIRGRDVDAGEKSSTNFYFQVIHPDAINAGLFAKGRSQQENSWATATRVVCCRVRSRPMRPGRRRRRAGCCLPRPRSNHSTISLGKPVDLNSRPSHVLPRKSVLPRRQNRGRDRRHW
jgi:L-2-hydroxycarboxylate dehydrogenase (NAD+)